jgi:hypothetical protein
MVALNFQTRDDPLLLNYGRFEDNGCCGYVLKPHFMRSQKSIANDDEPLQTFDHNKVMCTEGALTLTVRVISAFVLSNKRGVRNSNISNPYVKVCQVSYSCSQIFVSTKLLT